MTKSNKVKILLILIVLLSFLSFLDATYLTINHYQNTIPGCSIIQGCEKVLTSKFATLGPVPVALLGSFYFLIVLVISIILFQTRTKTILFGLLGLAILGFLVSVGFFLIQLLILKAFCLYCLFSEGISFLLLTFSLVLLRFKQEGYSTQGGD